MTTKYQHRAFWKDAANRLRFGTEAPRYAERIWVPPSECQRYVEAADLAAFFGSRVRQMSGRVVKDWPGSLEQTFDRHPKLTYCWSHWREGKSWEEAGAIDFMLGRIAVSPSGVTDKCRTPDDVARRFEALDGIWNEVRAKGRLPSRAELYPTNFREVGGILMHLGPGGEPIFSGAGCHRFAMAMMLTARFPAQLGVVHVSALERLGDFRDVNELME
ncbi:hypothetical protein DYI22_12140 [Marinobacter lipolyticus]|uniref:hypothetical protein n=1 Tax=Marinobacter lipolyticus TaxID=209639 RepID=UPI001BCEE876|nr:hypothetical protein [Marinobacter lipolyticus]MBS8241253.1 hypothetical protein [Marinobacter lipolyticus]